MFKIKKNMKNIFFILLLALLTFSCVGTSSVGIFGSGVSIAYDPRTVGMQIEDSIMQKNLIARLTLTDKKYIISIEKNKIISKETKTSCPYFEK